MSEHRPTWTTRVDASLPVAIEVLRRGPISRAALTHRLNLSQASLSRLTAPLVEQGLLIDVGEHNDGRVGRPQRLLDVDPNARSFIGMKLRETELIAARTNLRGEVTQMRTQQLASRDPDAVVSVIAEMIGCFADESAIDAVGIGLGGLVLSTGTVRRAPFLNWTDVDLAGMVTARSGIPTLVDNDVAAFTEYEHWFGLGNDARRFAVLTLGAGLGFGLVSNDEFVRNEDYGAGAIEHWPLRSDGPVCPVGHRGCSSAMISSDAIAAQATMAVGRPVSFGEALDLASAHDEHVEPIVQAAGEALGMLLAAVCNLTLPERIILGGEGVQLATIAYESIVRTLANYRDPLTHTPPVLIASGGNAEWCRGAAVLAIREFVLGRLLTRNVSRTD